MATLEQGALTIRHMTRQDIDAVLSLDRKFGKGTNSLSYKDMVTTDPGGPLDLSFVAEVAGTIVGCVIARLTYVMVPLTGICLLHSRPTRGEIGSRSRYRNWRRRKRCQFGLLQLLQPLQHRFVLPVKLVVAL